MFGRTAAASLKPTGARRTATRDEALTASRPETLQLIELASELAAELGLIVQETPSATLLKTRAMASVAIVYLASWDSLEIPLQPLRDRGWTSEADSIGATLQTITDKRLTAKAPNLPSVDAVAAWDTVSQLIRQIASLHAEHAN